MGERLLVSIREKEIQALLPDKADYLPPKASLKRLNEIKVIRRSAGRWRGSGGDARPIHKARTALAPTRPGPPHNKVRRHQTLV